MKVGILGGTGPAGRGLGLRLASVGYEVIIGSRQRERAAEVVEHLQAAWPGRAGGMVGGDNEAAAAGDVVVLATPWEAALPTVQAVSAALGDRVLISMAVALAKQGREMLPLQLPRGSVAASVQAAAPGARVAAALHHLPASEMENLDSGLEADVLVCSDHVEATSRTQQLIGDLPGLRAIDAGSLAQAAAIEAFTSVCITVNLRHRVHSSVRLSGI